MSYTAVSFLVSVLGLYQMCYLLHWLPTSRSVSIGIDHTKWCLCIEPSLHFRSFTCRRNKNWPIFHQIRMTVTQEHRSELPRITCSLELLPELFIVIKPKKAINQGGIY